MSDFDLFVGYCATGAMVLLVSVILLDRYWGTSLLRGLVKPKQRLFYDERPCWAKDPLKFQVLGLPVVAALLSYILILEPEHLPLQLLLLGPIWISASMMSLLGVMNCRAESKGNAKSEEHEKKPA